MGFASCLALVAAGCRGGGGEAPATAEVTLETTDGLRIAARRYTPRQENPPGLILVHRPGADGDNWTPFAERAQQAGYLVISPDLRGHGDSREQAGEMLDYRRFDAAAWADTQHDIGAARAHLLEAGADPANLFVAGEALGATLALQFAVANPDIQGVILLSPGLEDKGMDTAALIGDYARRPGLLVWAQGDAYAASAASTLQRRAPGHREAHSYAGASQGTNIFSTAPHAMGQILVWLDQMLEIRPETTGM